MGFFLMVLMVLSIELPINYAFAISKGESGSTPHLSKSTVTGQKAEETPTLVFPLKGKAGAPSVDSTPPVNACGYYPPNRLVRDIFRLQFQKRTCQSIPGIDKKLLDRPENETYKVGDPFDVPRRN
jgi:hypothetical protein